MPSSWRFTYKGVEGGLVMEDAKVRRLNGLNRSLILVIPLGGLLLASGIWNVRQYRLVERQRMKEAAMAEEARVAAIRAEAVDKQVKLAKKAADTEADARVSQLYQEINALTRMSEQLMLRDPSLPGTPAQKDSRGVSAGVP
jgi:hypothetical protein